MKMILLMVLLLVILTPLVAGQDVYTQPVYPSDSFNWSQHIIYVSIPSSPSWAHDRLSSSLKIWNDAQQWFLQTYYPNMTWAKYTLVEKPSTQEVTVAFVNISQTGTCGSDPTGSWTGCTWLQHDHARIEIILDLFVLEVANHELGHILGLADSLSNGDDLMNAKPLSTGNLYPSTLDLYAVFLVAKGTQFYDYTEIALPKGILYVQWLPDNSTSVPEFSSGLLALVISVCVCACVLATRRFRWSRK